MSGDHPDEHSHPVSRAQRRHFQDRNGKRYNTVRRPTFTDRLREEYRTRRVEEASKKPATPLGAVPTSGPGRRRAKARKRRQSALSGPFSPILPVPNEGHPLFRRRDPRLHEYTVC